MPDLLDWLLGPRTSALEAARHLDDELPATDNLVQET